jgi:phosphoserine phosphatase
LGHDVIIISDGNTLFIDQILSNYNLKPYITQLITNKVKEHGDGRLNLIPCRDPVKEAHDCENKLSSGKKLCNGNLCKGMRYKS